MFLNLDKPLQNRALMAIENPGWMGYETGFFMDFARPFVWI